MPIVGMPSGGIVALEQLSVARMFVGDQVSALGGGSLYKLSESSDAADGDEIVTVKDNASLRWIKQRVDTSTATTKIVPGTDGNVQVGPDGALEDDAVTGFLTVPLVSATFDADAALIDEGHAAIVVQQTATKCRVGVFIPGDGYFWTVELEQDGP